MTRTSAIIPVRGLHGGKSRLAAELHDDERMVLIAAMANRVIGAVTESSIAESIVIVSREADLLRNLRISGNRIRLVHQPAHSIGLNAAIDLGRRDALAREAERVLVLSADLPLLTPAAVVEFAAVDERAGVSVVTDRAGLGTNALLLRGTGTIARFSFRFGRDSRRLHRDEAARLGATYIERAISEIALDLDTPDDWAMLNGEMRQHLLIPRTTFHHSPFGAAGIDPAAILERA